MRFQSPMDCYRTVISNSVVEHIPDFQSVLREAYRLLAPGGRLYLTVPSDKFDQYTWISQGLSLIGLMVSATAVPRLLQSILGALPFLCAGTMGEDGRSLRVPGGRPSCLWAEARVSDERFPRSFQPTRARDQAAVQSMDTVSPPAPCIASTSAGNSGIDSEWSRTL